MGGTPGSALHESRSQPTLYPDHSFFEREEAAHPGLAMISSRPERGPAIVPERNSISSEAGLGGAGLAGSVVGPAWPGGPSSAGGGAGRAGSARGQGRAASEEGRQHPRAWAALPGPAVVVQAAGGLAGFPGAAADGPTRWTAGSRGKGL
jgi:hypothetical protein